jgi:hypothetical protein
MEAWAQELLDIWQTHKVEISQAILDGIERNPGLPIKPYKMDDMLQLTEGFIAMMREDLEGGSKAIWETYMNTVFPGVLAQGQPLSALVGQITMNAVICYNVTMRYASPEHRDQMGPWLTNWYVAWNSEIVRIGQEFYAENRTS